LLFCLSFQAWLLAMSLVSLIPISHRKTTSRTLAVLAPTDLFTGSPTKTPRLTATGASLRRLTDLPSSHRVEHALTNSGLKVPRCATNAYRGCFVPCGNRYQFDHRMLPKPPLAASVDRFTPLLILFFGVAERSPSQDLPCHEQRFQRAEPQCNEWITRAF